MSIRIDRDSGDGWRLIGFNVRILRWTLAVTVDVSR